MNARSIPARVPKSAALPALSLHIDRVVMNGLPIAAAAAPRLQAALDGELTRLLSTAPLGDEFRAGAALAALELPALQVGVDAGPGRIGRQLARALVDALTARRGASGEER